MSTKSDANIKKIINELSATSGGSLVKQIKKLKLTKERSVLFVGLGGLGSKTINEIKKIYSSDFEVAENIRFLAVDTCTMDQEKVSITNEEGSLTDDELFQIFDDDSVGLLIAPPPEVSHWVGNLTPAPLDATGAQGVRQIGRIMLCGTQKYLELKRRISSKIDEIHSTSSPINVVLIAGVSGGTGSGTFIDVAYMIQDILSTRRTENDDEVTFWGAFYTPNVQKSIPEIAESEAKWDGLCRNGYAAFKELDYFMNNGSQKKGSEAIYSLTAPGGIRVKSAEPLFDQGKVFIVGPNGSLTKVEEIVNAASHSLLNMFQNVDVQGGSQAIISNFSNMAKTVLPNWRKNNVGLPIEGKKADPMGIENTEFPAFMNYSYSSFGYSAVYFPLDEIMAYCANEVLTQVYSVWTDVKCLNQKNVYQWVNKYKLGSNAQIVSAIKEHMNVDSKVLRVNKIADAGSWPNVTMYLFGRGKVTETAVTMQCAKEKADNAISPYLNNVAVERMAEEIVKPFITYLASPSFVGSYGPFAAIATLTGYGDIRGCCDNLKDLKAKLKDDIAASKKKVELSEENMKTQGQLLENDHDPTDPEVETFIDACLDYSSTYFEYIIFSKLMSKILEKVDSKLQNFNNETFEIYVPIMESLIAMLNNDATFFAESNHSYYANGQSFGMDAYGISDSAVKREKFINLFKGYINADETQKIAFKFARSMFDAGSRDKWKSFRDHPEALADEIRKIFEDFFRPLVNNLLQKFVVLAYSEGKIKDLTPEKLDEIWDADPGTKERQIRDDAVGKAATAIAEALQSDGEILASVESGSSMLNKLDKTVSIILIKQMDVINKAIIAKMKTKPSVGYIGDDYKSVIYSVRFSAPLALPLIKNFNEFAQEYFDSENDRDTAAGRHLDERGQNWVKYLPELFGVDTENYYRATERNDLLLTKSANDNDRSVYSDICNAVGFCLENGIIFFDDSTDKCFKLIYDINSSDNFSSFAELYYDKLQNNPNVSLIGCLAAVEDEYHTVSYKTLNLICNNSPLYSRQTERPDDPRKISNLSRIVRSNMKFINLVLETYRLLCDNGNYAKGSVLEVISKQRDNAELESRNKSSADKYTVRISLFADMLLCDLVKYDDESKIWTFRRRKDREWNELCKFKKAKNSLDTLAKLYIAFTSGIWNLSDEMCAAIKQTCDDMMNDGDCKLRPEIIEEAKSVLSNDLMTDNLESERNKAINDLAVSSRYSECYGIPMQYDGASSVYDNLRRFYSDIIKKLNVTL